jgi:hypothetical protein
MAASRRASPMTIETDPESFDRASEISKILAAGLTRLETRKSSRKPTGFGECSLHFSPDQSGDVPPYSAEESP